MADDERTFWSTFEEARDEVQKWETWKRTETVDIYVESAGSQQQDEDLLNVDE
jgi:hypothetical protein